jgi:hypothetical protein
MASLARGLLAFATAARRSQPAWDTILPAELLAPEAARSKAGRRRPRRGWMMLPAVSPPRRCSHLDEFDPAGRSSIQ